MNNDNVLMDDESLFNYLDEYYKEESNDELCECGLKLIDICHICGQYKDIKIFEIKPSRSTNDNYNIRNRIKYSRYVYMKTYLYKIKRINILKYDNEIYELVIKAYNDNKHKLNITFRTFYFRIGLFKDEDLLQFLYYMNKDKINISEIDKMLTYETINKIATHYKYIHTEINNKWSNRNIFILFYYPEVYNIIKPCIFSTSETINKYRLKLYKF